MRSHRTPTTELPPCSSSSSNPVFIDENCGDKTGEFEGAVFHNCSFKHLNGLTLKKCDLSNSRFETDSIRDALDFTMTLNCLSFKGVEYSETLFDLLLCLMVQSKGNDEKRRKLVAVLGEAKLKSLLRTLHTLE